MNLHGDETKRADVGKRSDLLACETIFVGCAQTVEAYDAISVFNVNNEVLVFSTTARLNDGKHVLVTSLDGGIVCRNHLVEECQGFDVFLLGNAHSHTCDLITCTFFEVGRHVVF
jgi:hypothetical protein